MKKLLIYRNLCLFLYIMRNAAFGKRQRFIPEELVLIFALLICNTARGLASRLTRCLALATTAISNGLNNVLSLDGLDSLHDNIFAFLGIWMILVILTHDRFIISQQGVYVKRNRKI